MMTVGKVILYLQKHPVALGQALLNHGSSLGPLALSQGYAAQPAW